MWIRILLVAAGGAAGACCRYGTAVVAARLWGSTFPLGTLAVNLGGCFLIGLVFALADQRNLLGPVGRIWLMTGFLGAMTTFSTYALESIQFVRAGDIGFAVLNVAANNLAGLLLVTAGIWLGSRI